MAYKIELAPSAAGELRDIRVYDRRRNVEEMQGHLRHQPIVPTRKRKCLATRSPGFEHVPPLWELRVGKYRVFYDVDSNTQTVYERFAARHAAKPQERLSHERDNG